MRAQRSAGIRLRLALALVLVVAGALGVVYLIVVPSLEAELVNAKLDQLEEDAQTVARNYRDAESRSEAGVRRAGGVASVQARVVIYTILRTQPFVHGRLEHDDSSLDVARDPIALRGSATEHACSSAARSSGDGAPLRRGGAPLDGQTGVVILLSDSLADPLSSLQLIERRLLVAGLIGLLFAVVAG